MIIRSYKKFADLPNFKIVIVIFIIALIVRLPVACIAYYQNISDTFSDDIGYYNYATKIIDEGPFFTNIDGLRRDFVGPGLPWFIALCRFLFGDHWTQPG